MSTAAISINEPAIPQSADAQAATPKPACEKQSTGGEFDSVLAEKQKSSACADGQQPGGTPTEAAQVSDKQNADSKGDQTDGKKDDGATTNLALAYLLATLPGQNLPVEKIAVAQNAGLKNDAMQNDVAQHGGPLPNVTVVPATQDGKEIVSSPEISVVDNPSQIASQPSPALVSSTMSKAAAAEKSANDVPKPTPANHPAPAVITAAEQARVVLQTISLQASVAVTKSAGMSNAMHSPMQSVQVQQVKIDATNAQTNVSAPVAELPGHFTATTSDRNFGGNRDSENSSDAQQAFAATTTQAPSDATSLRATSDSFSPTLERTEHLQGVVNHVIEAADRMRSDGRTNVEVQVQLRDGQNLTIRLHWSDGQLQPVFKTESVELRNAIQQNWSQFTSGAGERGMKITTPVFQSSQSGMGDLNQHQSREQQQQPGAWQSENFSLSSQLKTQNNRAPALAPAAPQSVEGLALYA